MTTRKAGCLALIIALVLVAGGVATMLLLSSTSVRDQVEQVTSLIRRASGYWSGIQDIPATPPPSLPALPQENYSESWAFGSTAGTRPLEVKRWGNGEHKLAVVAGIHGQYEANTVALAQQLIRFADAEAAALLPPNTSLYIVPLLNPDGFAGSGRLNDHGVDLNRNWDCKWERQAWLNDQPVNPGVAAFSEPETRALRDLVFSEGIDAIVFLHSAGGSVALGVCHQGTALALQLGERVAEATGYVYYRSGSFYRVTGDATGYFNSVGVTAVEVELRNHADLDWEENVRALRAALAWVASRP